jgi:transposase
MGDTSSSSWGGSDTLEGVFGHGRKNAVCVAGEAMAELCREFGISRKTGYKIFDRYQECGLQGLTDRSRRPYRYANQLPFQVENFILNVKRREFRLGCCRKLFEAPELRLNYTYSL